MKEFLALLILVLQENYKNSVDRKPAFEHQW